MKIRITLAAAALLFCSISYADIVSEKAALGFANQYFNGREAATKSSYTPMTLVYTSQQGSFSSIDPEFYVFNRDGGGFVIISGESDYHPILGYSYTGTFNPDDIPDALVWILDLLTAEIDQVRESGTPVSQSIAQEWASIGTGTRASVSKVLTTADWSQGEVSNTGNVFNKLCPTMDGKHCYTGCVATATTILMHYHVNNNTPGARTTPVEGAVLPSYEWEKGGKTINGFSLEGHSYDFKNMPYSSSGCKSASKEIQDQIAQLHYDVGVALQMDYGTSGSSASTSNVIIALGTYFGYNKDNRLYLRDGYSEEDWFDMVKNSIDNGCPVVYDGYEIGGGGHCFIIDGYKNDNGALQYHINLGWGGGSYHAYFRIGDNYDFRQGAIFNLKPETGSSSFPAPVLAYYTGKDKGKVLYNGMNSYTGTSISSGYISALTPTDANNIYFRLLRGNSVLKTIGSYSLSKGYLHSYPFSFTRPSNVKLGETLRIEYSRDGKSTWIPLNEPNDGSAVIEYPLIPMFVLDLPGTVSIGKYELKLKNGDTPWSYQTNWSCKTISGGGTATISQGNSGNRWFITFTKAGTYDVTGTVSDYNGEFYDCVTARIVVK